MDRFLTIAARILEGGRSAAEAGFSEPAWTVLIGQRGGVRMVAGADWPLSSLAREHNAAMAYRVHAEGGKVRVDGMGSGRRCAMEYELPSSTLHRLLPDRRQYQLAPSPSHS